MYLGGGSCLEYVETCCVMMLEQKGIISWIREYWSNCDLICVFCCI